MLKSINHIDIIENLFKFFKISHLFINYRRDIQQLIDLLADYSNKKTGLLLQILIPKTQIDYIAYRGQPGYYPYYGENATKHNASDDLSNYQNNSFSLFPTPDNVDEMQLRLLINKYYLLNPNQPRQRHR